MENFDFFNPVKILFGEGKISEISGEIPSGSKILFTYGGGSIKRNGVYQQVMEALTGFEVYEFGGIEPNPKYETLMKGVEMGRNAGIDFILAVGGGSVLDGTKFIAAAIPFTGDPWTILTGGRKVKIEKVIPIGTVLTLAATGSEMNSGGVISRESTKEKLAFGNPLLYPKFSVLDPTTTYSLPSKQIANGIVDAYIHVTEQYLTYPANVLVQDRWAEGLLQTLIEIGPQALANPNDYETRANLMWCCTMALNGIIAVGAPTDWATHIIGHELTAFFGLDHAETLAIILPSLLLEMKDEKKEKLFQYGTRVWGIDEKTEGMRIIKSIEKTEKFFQSLGIKTKLSEYGISAKDLEPIVERFINRNWKLGENKTVTPDVIKRVLINSV